MRVAVYVFGMSGDGQHQTVMFGVAQYVSGIPFLRTLKLAAKCHAAVVHVGGDEQCSMNNTAQAFWVARALGGGMLRK